MQPNAFPVQAGRYDALAPLKDSAETFRAAAANLCAPHGLRARCFCEADESGVYLNIEVRNTDDALQFTAMGSDPLVELKRLLPQSL